MAFEQRCDSTSDKVQDASSQISQASRRNIRQQQLGTQLHW
jgi:hypothetical protein